MSTISNIFGIYFVGKHCVTKSIVFDFVLASCLDIYFFFFFGPEIYWIFYLIQFPISCNFPIAIHAMILNFNLSSKVYGIGSYLLDKMNGIWRMATKHVSNNEGNEGLKGRRMDPVG